jgi:hypothetical protein
MTHNLAVSLDPLVATTVIFSTLFYCTPKSKCSKISNRIGIIVLWKLSVNRRFLPTQPTHNERREPYKLPYKGEDGSCQCVLDHSNIRIFYSLRVPTFEGCQGDFTCNQARGSQVLETLISRGQLAFISLFEGDSSGKERPGEHKNTLDCLFIIFALADRHNSCYLHNQHYCRGTPAANPLTR